MIYPRIEFNEVNISFSGIEDHTKRSEHISRLIFHYLQNLMERELQHLGSDILVDRLDVPLIEIPFETMDDETIARLSAEGIRRAILQVK